MRSMFRAIGVALGLIAVSSVARAQSKIGYVDTQALIAALSDGAIAGAALDVYEDEPQVPAALLALDNVVCTPHMAGRSPEAEKAQTDLLLANLRAFFGGGTPVSPVP